MYVNNVSADGNKSEVYIENPSWEQIKSVLFALNGDHLNVMAMGRYYKQKGRENDIKEFMAISGGGENQLYLCKIYSYEDEFDEIWL